LFSVNSDFYNLIQIIQIKIPRNTEEFRRLLNIYKTKKVRQQIEIANWFTQIKFIKENFFTKLQFLKTAALFSASWLKKQTSRQLIYLICLIFLLFRSKYS